MASPKSHTVSPLALCSLTVRAPSLATAVTQKAAAENGKAWDSCDKPLAFTRANEAGGRLWRPSALCCISGFFFFSSPASHCSEFSPWPNFICEKMPSERACRDVWACTPEEGQQSVCTQRMEKNVSVLQRLLNTLFPKWISSFQQG